MEQLDLNRRYPKKLAPGVAIIGHYYPTSTLDSWEIRLAIPAQVKKLLGDISGEVREPTDNLRIRHHEIAGSWHHDGMFGDSPTAMVVWSNREQTEVQLSNGTVIQPDPGDIVLVHNTMTKHRSPQKMSEDRWFFRSHISVPTWLCD